MTNTFAYMVAVITLLVVGTLAPQMLDASLPIAELLTK